MDFAVLLVVLRDMIGGLMAALAQRVMSRPERPGKTEIRSDAQEMMPPLL